MSEHKSVLLNESIEGLNVKQNGLYLDCNLGGGGHTKEIIRLGGLVVGLDIDLDATKKVEKDFKEEISKGKLRVINENFVNLGEVVEKEDLGRFDGIIYDLGLSTFQLKDENKGFSFNDDVPMDMRMDQSLNVSANDLLKVLTADQLEALFREYGEEPQARLFARELKREFERSSYDMTAREVAEFIKKTSKYKKSRIHPATRVFQAFRIAVNSELDNFEKSAKVAASLLRPKGRLVIITFHSLEDKIAKNLAKLPHLKKINKKPVTPSAKEVEENPSSRSAKLRIYEYN